jgi:DNA-binding FadR family transcriptional regulator
LIRNLNSVLISSNVDTLCHETIDESSGNPILTADLNNLRIICSRIWTSSLREKLPLSQFSSQWMNIYQAVKDSDGETAGSIMLEHVQSTIQCLREGFF